MPQALELVAPLLLAPGGGLTAAGHRRAVAIALRAAREHDPQLARVVAGGEIRLGEDVASGVVKSFFYGGALAGDTLYQQVRRREEELNARCIDGGAKRPDFRIEFLKNYSSYTPLTDHGDSSRGGGYFLVARKFGCVIDPGHNFLENFDRRHSIGEIDAVVVTHCHDDHNADLSSLLSLLYRRRPRRRVRLILDERTFEGHRHLIETSDYIQQPCQPLSAPLTGWSANGPFTKLSRDVHFQPVPSSHKLTPSDRGTTAFGLHFVLGRHGTARHVVISGDTTWNSSLVRRAYRALAEHRPVLIAHVSTACTAEGVGILGFQSAGYHSNHLGVRGAVEMIQACKPTRVVLSEVGEELRDVIHGLASRIETAFGTPCYVGMMDDARGAVLDLTTHDPQLDGII